MKLSKCSLYALPIIELLKQASRPVRGNEIAQAVGTTSVNLVLNAMRAQGIICAKRGPGGGYRLAKPLRDISLLSILQVTTEWTDMLGMVYSGKLSAELKAVQKRLSDAVVKALSPIKLTDL